MDTQIRHPMLVQTTHDELMRQQFVHNLRLHLASAIGPGNDHVYTARVEPAFRKKHGRAPKDRHEVRRDMQHDPYYRLYCATQRASQEMMWDAVIDSVERDLPRLKKQASGRAKTASGTLRTDPSFRVPAYHTAADIHLQPGGYHRDTAADDMTAGAIYDRSVYIYAIGGLGGLNDDLGQTVVDHVKANFPALKPRRILDMGCAVGHSTLPWVDAFPKAEVHGIDCGAGMLRYAHARAQNLGKTAHFSQQNAEKTDFKPGSFDLVVSHIMLHETSRSALQAIFAESWRLLAPGGVMLHMDLPQAHGMAPFPSFMQDWEAYNNNETFAVVCRDLDWPAMAIKAGFKPGKVSVEQSITHIAAEELKAGRQPAYARPFPILVGRK